MMPTGKASGNAVLAKARALYGSRLRADDYRRLMACAQQRGLTVTGFSREITLIDYGITDDTEKFVTEISLPVAPQA